MVKNLQECQCILRSNNHTEDCKCIKCLQKQAEQSHIRKRIRKNSKEYSKKYYLNNKERYRQYYLINKDKIREQKRISRAKYMLNNKERIAERERNYRARNAKKIQEYRARNRERFLEYWRNYNRMRKLKIMEANTREENHDPYKAEIKRKRKKYQLKQKTKLDELKKKAKLEELTSNNRKKIQEKALIDREKQINKKREDAVAHEQEEQNKKIMEIFRKTYDMVYKGVYEKLCENTKRYNLRSRETKPIKPIKPIEPIEPIKEDTRKKYKTSEKKRLSVARYRERNIEKVKEKERIRQRIRRKQNGDSYKENIKKYRIINEDKIRDSRRKYYIKNRDKVLEGCRKYKADNKEIIREKNKRYKQIIRANRNSNKRTQLKTAKYINELFGDMDDTFKV